MSRKPKLIVFDLDFHTAPPFKKNRNGQIVDSRLAPIICYKDVPEVLKKLKNEGYLLAVASRTTDPKGAQQLLTLLDWDHYFTYKEMYPGSKKTHFANIARDSGITYAEMLFFDDEHRNIFDITRLGAKCFLVTDGVSLSVVEEGLKQFNR